MHKVLTSLLLAALLSGCLGAAPKPTAVVTAEERQAAMEGSARVRSESLSREDKLRRLHDALQDSKPDYSLGKGDVLSVLVYDEEDLSLERVPVSPAGTVSLPLIGAIKADDLTADEFARAVEQALSEFVFNPQVSVSVLEFNSLEFTILGEVTDPGVYPLLTAHSLIDAISRAGGLNKGVFKATTMEVSDLTNAFISRNGKVLPVDFYALLREGDLRFDIEVFPNDFIYIPSGLAKEVYVLGEVNKATAFAWTDNMPMTRIITLTEGFTRDADMTRIHIVRGSLQNPTLIVSNYKAVLSGMEQDVPMEAGDIIYVPPKGLASFARMMDYIVPTMQTIWTGALVSTALTQ